MKKVSLLVLICMLASLILASFAGCAEEEVEHTHTYGEEWIVNATNHYHVCDCGAKSESAAHADANNDGACDTCGVILENNHVYDTAWTSDETNHWHAPLCGHDVAVADKAAHTTDILGVCAVCGYDVSDPTISTIADALGVATYAQGNVIGGSVTYQNPNATTTVKYEALKGYFHSYSADDNKNIYVNANEDGTVCYVEITPADMTPATVIKAADAKYLNGVAIDLEAAIGDAVTVYGVMELLNFFYETYPASVEDTEIEITESIADGVYTFYYSIPVDEDNSITVFAYFTLDSNGYFINDMEIRVGDSAINYTQWTTPVVDYLPEDVVPTGVKFENVDGEALTFSGNTAAPVAAGIETYTITLVAEGAEDALLAALGDVTVALKDAEGNEVSTDNAATFFSNSTYEIHVYLKAEGTYYLHVTIGETNYVIPMVAAYALPTEINALIFNEQSYMYEPMQENTVKIYTGSSVQFAAEVSEGSKVNAYSMTVADSNATVTSLDLQDDGFGGEILVYEFKATVAGTYTMTVTSTADETVTTTVTVIVSDPPTAAELATGKWEGGNAMLGGAVTVNFYPTDDTKGVAVVSTTVRGNAVTVIFTYYIHEGEFVATPTTENMTIQSLSINDKYEIVINKGNPMNQKVCAKVADEADAWTGETLPEAPGYVEDVAPAVEKLTNGATTQISSEGTYTYEATIGEDGTFSFTIDNYTNGADYSVTVSAGSVAVAGLTDVNADEAVAEVVESTDYYITFNITGDAAAVITITIVASNVTAL